MAGNSDLRHWLDRAEKARVKADHMKDPKSKRRMLSLANFYKSLAEQTERRIWKRTSRRCRKLGE
jgi:hypothetical protein